MHTYRLKGASGKVANQSFGLGQRTIIGRSPECELHIDDPGVAPRHAEICLDETAGLMLRQLDSGFQTRLNGAVVKLAALSAGDEIQVGNFRWVVQAPGLRPDKVLTATAVERRRNYLPWLIAIALIAAAALAWQRGWF